MQGEVAVHLDLSAPAIATLTPGDIVGEGALLSDDPRAASVVATEDSHVLVLTKSDLTMIVSRYPALGEEMQLFVDDRTQALAATAGAKMERFVQAREDEKRQMLQQVRSLAGKLTLGWTVVSWGLILVLWRKIICGAIDGDVLTAASGSGSAEHAEMSLNTPCTDAATLAYQVMRVFFTVGPALFAISDWDVDAASRMSPNKCRLALMTWMLFVRCTP
jgi:hypothetical protein